MGRKGFSLVELLVVIGIASVLIAVSVANYSGLRAKAREQEAKAHGGAVAQTIANYLSTNITLTADAFMALPEVSRLPRADWSGAAGAVGSPREAADRSCRGSGSLPGGYVWGDAPRGVGCAFGVRTVGSLRRVLVFTWVEGSGAYYVNGERP